MATRGQVKWFDPKKGFGFIVGPDGQDVFVHYSHIESDGFRTLKDGQTVEYELVEGEKGWQARDVKGAAEADEGADAGGDDTDTNAGGDDTDVAADQESSAQEM